jgi:hypothetical protein
MSVDAGDQMIDEIDADERSPAMRLAAARSGSFTRWA